MTSLQTGSNEPQSFDSPQTNGIDVPQDYGVTCPVCQHKKNITNKCSECGFPIATAKKSIATILENAFYKEEDYQYISSELGKRKWFDNLAGYDKPFRLKQDMYDWLKHKIEGSAIEQTGLGTWGHMLPNCDCEHCQAQSEQEEETPKDQPAPKKCQNCDKMVSDGEDLCPECQYNKGKELASIYLTCPLCLEEELHPDTLKCGGCKEPLKPLLDVAKTILSQTEKPEDPSIMFFIKHIHDSLSTNEPYKRIPASHQQSLKNAIYAYLRAMLGDQHKGKQPSDVALLIFRGLIDETVNIREILAWIALFPPFLTCPLCQKSALHPDTLKCGGCERDLKGTIDACLEIINNAPDKRPPNLIKHTGNLLKIPLRNKKVNVYANNLFGAVYSFLSAKYENSTPREEMKRVYFYHDNIAQWMDILEYKRNLNMWVCWWCNSQQRKGEECKCKPPFECVNCGEDTLNNVYRICDTCKQKDIKDQEKSEPFSQAELAVIVNKVCDKAKDIIWQKMGQGKWYNEVTIIEAKTYLTGILYSQIDRLLTPPFKPAVKVEIDKIIDPFITGLVLISPIRDDDQICTYETIYNTFCDTVTRYLKGDTQLSQDKPPQDKLCDECGTPLKSDQYGKVYCPKCDPYHNIPIIQAPKKHGDWGIFYDKVNKSARRISFMDGGESNTIHIDDVVFLLSYWENTFSDMDLIMYIRAVNQVIIDQITQYHITTMELEKLIVKVIYKIDNSCPKCRKPMWFTLEIDCYPHCENCSTIRGLSVEEDLEAWLKFLDDIFVCHHINRLNTPLSPKKLNEIVSLSKKQRLIIDDADKDKCTIITLNRFPYPF